MTSSQPSKAPVGNVCEVFTESIRCTTCGHTAKNATYKAIATDNVEFDRKGVLRRAFKVVREGSPLCQCSDLIWLSDSESNEAANAQRA